MAEHRSGVKEAPTVPRGLRPVDLGPKPGEHAHGPKGLPDPVAALAALEKGQVAIVTFPPAARDELDQWRARLWSAANQLRRARPERGLLCTTVREEAAGHSLYFWYAADGEGEAPGGQGVGVFLQGYSVAEAAQVLGVSEKTIRRHIKAGRLSATLFSGPRGPEYRIESLELREQPADTSAPEAEDALGGDTAETPPAAPAAALDQFSAAVMDQAELEGAASALLGEFQVLLSARERRIEELQQEKMQLAGQLGAIMERARHLEEQLRLLSAPKPKRPWWRLFFLGRG